MSYDYKCPVCLSNDIFMEYHETLEGDEYKRQCNTCKTVFQVYEP
jgi:hypothetical protein